MEAVILHCVPETFSKIQTTISDYDLNSENLDFLAVAQTILEYKLQEDQDSEHAI